MISALVTLLTVLPWTSGDALYWDTVFVAVTSGRDFDAGLKLVLRGGLWDV